MQRELDGEGQSVKEGCLCLYLCVTVCSPAQLQQGGGDSGYERFRLELEAHLPVAGFESCYI